MILFLIFSCICLFHHFRFNDIPKLKRPTDPLLTYNSSALSIFCAQEHTNTDDSRFTPPVTSFASYLLVNIFPLDCELSFKILYYNPKYQMIYLTVFNVIWKVLTMINASATFIFNSKGNWLSYSSVVRIGFQNRKIQIGIFRSAIQSCRSLGLAIQKFIYKFI